MNIGIICIFSTMMKTVIAWLCLAKIYYLKGMLVNVFWSVFFVFGLKKCSDVA